MKTTKKILENGMPFVVDGTIAKSMSLRLGSTTKKRDPNQQTINTIFLIQQFSKFQSTKVIQPCCYIIKVR